MTPLLSAERDFVSLFAVEPHIADSGVPWSYNRVAFETVLGADHIRFEMCPGFLECTFSWHRDGALLAHLELSGVVSFEVREDAKEGLLRLAFEDEPRGVLFLRLRPAVQLEWRKGAPPGSVQTSR
jgi:hypothetical protein